MIFMWKYGVYYIVYLRIDFVYDVVYCGEIFNLYIIFNV